MVEMEANVCGSRHTRMYDGPQWNRKLTKRCWNGWTSLLQQIMVSLDNVVHTTAVEMKLMMKTQSDNLQNPFNWLPGRRRPGWRRR